MNGCEYRQTILEQRAESESECWIGCFKVDMKLTLGTWKFGINRILIDGNLDGSSFIKDELGDGWPESTRYMYDFA